MWDDPIVAEVRRVRAAHAAQFNNDLLAIFRDLKVHEQKSGREFVTFPACQTTPVKKELDIFIKEMLDKPDKISKRRYTKPDRRT